MVNQKRINTLIKSGVQRVTYYSDGKIKVKGGNFKSDKVSDDFIIRNARKFVSKFERDYIDICEEIVKDMKYKDLDDVRKDVKADFEFRKELKKRVDKQLDGVKGLLSFEFREKYIEFLFDKDMYFKLDKKDTLSVVK